jgi:hypothetical protein
MITSYELFQKLIGTANTHQGGHVRPNRNFIDWVNDISLEIFNEEYQAWEKTQVISDRLSVFLSSVNVQVVPVGGQMWDLITLPADYEHFSSARVIRLNGAPVAIKGLPVISSVDGCSSGSCTTYIDADQAALNARAADLQIIEKDIEKVTNNRWGSICEHKFLRPTFDAPKCTQFDGGLKIAPKGLGIIVLDYLRLPRKATFDYTLINPGTEDEFMQYNAATSISLEWKQTLIPEFLSRLETKYGKYVRDPGMYQMAVQDGQRLG